jgi:hypothetical protein
MLGVVDDVVESGRQRIAVGGVEGRPPRAPAVVEAVDDVVGDALALLLAQEDVARQAGVLGVVRQELAQQQRGPLDVVPRLLDQLEQAGIVGAEAQRHRPAEARSAGAFAAPRSPVFHETFTGT